LATLIFSFSWSKQGQGQVSYNKFFSIYISFLSSKSNLLVAAKKDSNFWFKQSVQAGELILRLKMFLYIKHMSDSWAILSFGLAGVAAWPNKLTS